MSTERVAFGPSLRVARERAGVPLEEIANSTKINVALLAELENNDVSHWPRGIYRRAFFREYLAAIGIASDSLVDEFVRLFPDDGSGVRARTPAGVTSEFRLTLARAPRVTAKAGLASAAAALIDICLVLSLAGVATWLTGVDTWAGVALVALAYYSVATTLHGRTPGVVWLTRSRAAAVPPRDEQEQRHPLPQPMGLPLAPRSPEAPPDDGPPRLHAVSG